jgi:small-conductance mechanosensitive channel
MMKNKGIIVLGLIMLLFTASQIFLGMQILKYGDSIDNLASRLDGLRENADLRLEHLEKEIQSLEETQKTGIAGMAGMLESLDQLNNKSDAQISLTAGLKKTYDDLYEEQRKKTLDTTSQDTAIAQIKKEADRLYSEKKYAAAYKEYVKVLSYQNDDMESRLKKMKSLYYRNRTDSSKYSEILEDIKILRSNGHIDNEAAEIEKVITAEREGLNE